MSADLRILEESNLVLTTPDKFDMVSRRWKQKRGKVIQELNLLVADDLHLLEDQEIGPIYEAVVSRMRFIHTQLQSPNFRICGFAASLANAKDIAEWIGASYQTLHNFSPNVRQVPLEMMINGFDVHNRNTRLQAMSRPVYQAIKNNAPPPKPVLVFVSDRKQCRLVALDLLLAAAADDQPKRFLNVRDEVLAPHLKASFIEKREALKQCLSFGVGFLHEGFSEQERKHVCNLYSAGALQVGFLVLRSVRLCYRIPPHSSRLPTPPSSPLLPTPPHSSPLLPTSPSPHLPISPPPHLPSPPPLPTSHPTSPLPPSPLPHPTSLVLRAGTEARLQGGKFSEQERKHPARG